MTDFDEAGCFESCVPGGATSLDEFFDGVDDTVGGEAPPQFVPELPDRVLTVNDSGRSDSGIIGCGSGPGSITVDLAAIVAPGEAIGIDRRDNALKDGRILARERGIANVAFTAANIYQLPFVDGSFDAAFSCAVLQHLTDPHAALTEIRRVLKPDGVIGIVDGSSPITFRYPTNPLLAKWDSLRLFQRAHNTGRPSETLQLRTLLREAGFSGTHASGTLATEAGAPARSPEETQRAARNDLIRLRGVLGSLAVAQGWVIKDELEQIATALIA